MRAVRIHEHGGPEALRLDDVPVPEAAGDGVRIAVKAASVNHLDLFIRRGMPGLKIPLPRRLGSDAAGVVDAVGPDVRERKPGERVLINPGISCGRCEFCAAGEGSLCLTYSLIGEHCDGAQAEYVTVPERNVHPIPEGMSFEEAAAVPLVFLTAWRMLITKARVQPGEDVLILGAGAGVGTAAIQIARTAGARVWAVAGGPGKLGQAKALGAEVLIDHRTDDFEKVVRERTFRRGVDVVIDYVGKETWVKSLRCLRRGGRLATCGATTGFDPQEDLRHIFYRQLTIYGSTMGSPAEFEHVMRGFHTGRFKAVVGRVLPLEQAAEAHRLLEGRGVFGKIVLTV